MANRSENMAVEGRGGNHAPWVLIAGGFHYFGGMDKANAALAAYLLERKTPLHLVAHQVDPQFSEHPGVKVHLVPRPAGSFFIGEWFLNRCGKAIAQQITGRWPGARVVANGGNCIWSDINWVHSVHHAWPCADDGSPLVFKMKNRAAKNWARRRERLSIRASHLVLTNSEQTRRHVISFFQIEPDKVHTVHLGTDPEWGPPTPAERTASRGRLSKSEKRPLVLFVGALSHDRNKGFDTLWSAWRILCSQPDWDGDLIVAGGGNGVAKWKSEVANAGLAHRVLFLGFTNRVQDLLAAADLLVSPVRYEAYGLNVQEAICRGVPALISRTTGIAERYQSDLAPMLLPDPTDVDDLVRKLLSWRSSIPYWRERFEPLAAVLRSYTWTEMARRIVAIAEAENAGHEEFPCQDLSTQNYLQACDPSTQPR